MYLRKNRVAIKIEGPDAFKFLQNAISQDLRQLNVDIAVCKLACLLNQKGGVLAYFWLHQSSTDSYILDVENSMFEVLWQELHKYKMRAQVKIQQLEYFKSYWSFSNEIKEGFKMNSFSLQKQKIYRLSALSPNSRDLKNTVSDKEWDIFRIQQQWPQWQKDVSSGMLPLQSEFLSLGLHFNKGCYLGQETIARLYSRGSQVARKLFCVRLEGHALEEGADLFFEQKSVGQISSSCFLDSVSWGLALIHRKAWQEKKLLEIKSEKMIEVVHDE